MKATKRLIMFVLVLAMTVSVLAIPAMAADPNPDTVDEYFSFQTSSAGSFSQAAAGRQKYNYTPVYVYPESGSDSIRVQIRGATSRAGTYNYGYYGSNQTFYYYTLSAGGTGLYYVTCYRGTRYGVHTNIWEHLARDNNYSAFASPYMCTGYAGGYATGLWSADSTYAWNEPIY